MPLWFHFYSESSTGAENYNASVPSGPYHAHHQVQIPTSSPSKAGLEAASGGGGNVLLSPMSVIHSSPLTVSSQATTGGHTVRGVKPTFRYGKHFLYQGGGQGRPSPLQNRWINKNYGENNKLPIKALAPNCPLVPESIYGVSLRKGAKLVQKKRFKGLKVVSSWETKENC